MPVITFTDADAMQTTTVEPGIYPSQITQIQGPKPSKSGKSNSYFFDIQISAGKFKGKETTLVFNTETSSPSLLGDMKYFPVSYMLQVDAAINGNAPGAKALDTDDLLFKPFDSQWTVQTVEGRLVNDVVAFHPSGYGATAPSF